MKKLLALLLAFGLVGFVAGCEGEDTKSTKTETNTPADDKDAE